MWGGPGGMAGVQDEELVAWVKGEARTLAPRPLSAAATPTGSISSSSSAAAGGAAGAALGAAPSTSAVGAGSGQAGVVPEGLGEARARALRMRTGLVPLVEEVMGLAVAQIDAGEWSVGVWGGGCEWSVGARMDKDVVFVCTVATQSSGGLHVPFPLACWDGGKGRALVQRLWCSGGHYQRQWQFCTRIWWGH